MNQSKTIREQMSPYEMGEVEIIDSEERRREKDIIKKTETAFEKIATKAFMAIRQHAHVLLNLLILMLVSGMEELSMKSIKFMKKAFFLEFSDAEAVTFFKGKIQQARKTVVFRKFDNFFHLYNGDKKKKGQAKTEAAAKKS